MTVVRQRLPAQLQTWGAPARAYWRGMGSRDRKAALIAAVVLGLYLLWTVAVAPALRTLQEAPLELERLDAQLQQMQRQATEGRELRATPAVAPSQGAAALQAATTRLGDKARLTLSGERATITLTGVNGTQLREWLAESRSGARARPIEAQLTRGPQGYTGSVVMVLGSGAGS
jgi:general secretion pathway protein M